MYIERKENARHIANDLYAVDIGNGKTLVLKMKNKNTDEGKVPPSKNSTYGYVKNVNESDDFSKWLTSENPNDLIDEKDLIKRFVSSGKNGIMSYKINGKVHLLLMLGGSFYHYIVDKEIGVPMEKIGFKRYEVTVTDRLNTENRHRFFTNDISVICRNEI